MIAIDLEIVTLLFIIILLIYNYNSNNYKSYSNCNKYNNYVTDEYYPMSSRQYINSPFGNKSPHNIPAVEKEFFDQTNVNETSLSDPQQLPDNVKLNDRYNDFITAHSDDELSSIVLNSDYNKIDSDYNQSLVNDLQKNIMFDVDTKAYLKSMSTQKIGKDSATIAARFGRNSLISSYKNELDEYEKERTPWWADTDNDNIPAVDIYNYR
jgi:hypothetical protein